MNTDGKCKVLYQSDVIRFEMPILYAGYAVCKNELKCKVNLYAWYDLSFPTFLYGNG